MKTSSPEMILSVMIVAIIFIQALGLAVGHYPVWITGILIIIAAVIYLLLRGRRTH